MNDITAIFWCRCERARTDSWVEIEVFVPELFKSNDHEIDLFSILESKVAKQLGTDWELITFQPKSEEEDDD